MLTISKEEWIDNTALNNKIKEWKEKQYSLDDVISNLIAKDYKLNNKLVSIKKLISLWNYKQLDL